MKIIIVTIINKCSPFCNLRIIHSEQRTQFWWEHIGH